MYRRRVKRMSTATGGFGWDSADAPWDELRSRLAAHVGRLSMAGPKIGGFRHFGAPPWAGPWGPPWGGRGSGSGRPRAAKGNVRTAILALLWEGPRHGYQLMQDIAERSHDAWRPSPGSVYPVLSALQDEGLVDDEKIEGRRVFSLTEAGHAHVGERAEDLATVFDAYEQREEPEQTDTRALVAGVAAAAVQVLATGTPAQVQGAQQLLAQARRDLYALLAEDEQ
jgi:DNA-binding PadR family transcriptional regulator